MTLEPLQTLINSLNVYEIPILDFIQTHFRCGFLDATMPIITRLGDKGLFWIAVAIVMLFFRKTRKTGWTVGGALLLGLIFVNILIKPLAGRMRPYDFNSAVQLLIPAESDFSFPSGHTVASFEAATALMLRDKRFGIPALVLAVIIAFSRLYLYVHYPTDVLAAVLLGILFGILSFLIVNFIYKKIENRKETHLES